MFHFRKHAKERVEQYHDTLVQVDKEGKELKGKLKQSAKYISKQKKGKNPQDTKGDPYHVS